MKRAENKCPWCGEAISPWEKLNSSHKYPRRCKACGNKWRLSVKWSLLTAVPVFLVASLMLFEVNPWLIFALLFPAATLKLILDFFFTPLEKKE